MLLIHHGEHGKFFHCCRNANLSASTWGRWPMMASRITRQHTFLGSTSIQERQRTNLVRIPRSYRDKQNLCYWWTKVNACISNMQTIHSQHFLPICLQWSIDSISLVEPKNNNLQVLMFRHECCLDRSLNMIEYMLHCKQIGKKYIECIINMFQMLALTFVIPANRTHKKFSPDLFLAFHGLLLILKLCVVWWFYLPSLAILPMYFDEAGIPTIWKNLLCHISPMMDE